MNGEQRCSKIGSILNASPDMLVKSQDRLEERQKCVSLIKKVLEIWIPIRTAPPLHLTTGDPSEL